MGSLALGGAAEESKYLGQGYRASEGQSWNLHLVWLQSAGAEPQDSPAHPGGGSAYIHLIEAKWFVVPEGWLKVIIWSPSKLSSELSVLFMSKTSLISLLGKATALVRP